MNFAKFKIQTTWFNFLMIFYLFSLHAQEMPPSLEISASEPVVTISSGLRITALFSSLASKEPAEITTAPSSFASSSRTISMSISFPVSRILSSLVL